MYSTLFDTGQIEVPHKYIWVEKIQIKMAPVTCGLFGKLEKQTNKNHNEMYIYWKGNLQIST